MAKTKPLTPKFKKNSVKQKAPAAKTRKELRKEQRKQKKVNRALYYEKKSHDREVPQNATGKLAKTQFDRKGDVAKQVESSDQESKNLKKMEERKKLEERKAKEVEKRRVAQLSEANFKEDKEIKKLEKWLKLNKRKSKNTPQSFINDGLDYILDFCNEKDRSQLLETEKQILNEDMGTDFDEDFNMIMGIEERNEKVESVKTHKNPQKRQKCEFSSDEQESDDYSIDELQLESVGSNKSTQSQCNRNKANSDDEEYDHCNVRNSEWNKNKSKKHGLSNTPGKFVRIRKVADKDVSNFSENSEDSDASVKQTNQNLEPGKYVRIRNAKRDSTSKHHSIQEDDEIDVDCSDEDIHMLSADLDDTENSECSECPERDHLNLNRETIIKKKKNCTKNTNKIMKPVEAGRYVRLKKAEYESNGEEVEDESLKKHNSRKKIINPKRSSKKKVMIERADVEESDDSSNHSESKYSSVEESSEELDQSDGGSKNSLQNENKGVDNEYWEDIYGRRRDKDGNVVQSMSKYVPPAARSNSSQNENLRLRRQLKGLVNRLAEHNMHTIATQIEDLYMTNSRNAMNEVLASLMLEALVSPIITPDRMIAEHMMLIAILHANVGIEVGAHFLLTIVRKIDEGLKEEQSVDNKEMDNMILMLAHLYNFKIYGHKLLYQILDKLAAKFTEKEIELILLTLRSVGFPLRKDDPIALKDLILNLQQKASSTATDSSRVKFMLDILLAIKNNNVNKIPQYDPSHVEHLKKLMKSFLRKGNTVTQFNISLEDLLHANERGKWWVVGSAWSGTEIDKKQDPSTKELIFSQQMLELARKQRMNTDVRRNIFCIIMSAEDYLDAFEKLHRLGLKDQQERELIYVLMDCCLQEKNFNPYYAVLAQKFCEYERRFQLTIQYTLWDKLKTLNAFSDRQLSNLARFLTFLFIENAMCFSALKVIEFTELDNRTMRLLRQIILGILLHENADACASVFERISVSPKLQQFREGLRLFINHFLMKNVENSEALADKTELLRNRTELVDKVLVSRANKTIF